MLFFIVFSLFVKAQNQYPYPFFPNDQHCYLGGFPEFYKEFHKILIEEKLKPCEKKDELFIAFIIINPDNKAVLLENNWSNENKCSYELAKEVIPKMDRWIPAKINGEEKSTIARVMFYMDDLFDKYETNYSIGKFVSKSNFDVAKFRDDVIKRVDISGFVIKGNQPLRIKTTFVINEKGELDEVEMVESSGLKEFDEMILYAIKQTLKNKKWEPAKVHDIAIKSRFYLPFSIKG